DCFLRVFRCDHSTLVARATAAIDLDTADAARTVAALRDAASTAAVSPEAVRLFYHAHLPLKRRAFRLGLLAAADRPDRPWPERPALAAEALAADPIFASLH